MVFKKGNTFGRKANLIELTVKAEIENLLKDGFSFGRIQRDYAFSITKMKRNGLKSIRKKYVKNPEKQAKKMLFSEIPKNITLCFMDITDLDIKSNRKANKSAKSLFLNGYGLKIGAVKVGDITLFKSWIVKKCKKGESSDKVQNEPILGFEYYLGTGEKAIYWTDLYNLAIKNGLKFDWIAVDSNANIEISNQPIISIKKTQKHPHNYEIEYKFAIKENLRVHVEKMLKMKNILEIKVFAMAEIALYQREKLPLKKIKEIENKKLEIAPVLIQ
jgi:hypothetical protein